MCVDSSYIITFYIYIPVRERYIVNSFFSLFEFYQFLPYSTLHHINTELLRSLIQCTMAKDNDPEQEVQNAAEKGAYNVGKLGTALGVLLVVQGLIFYILTGRRSLTAAIPSFVGGPLSITSFFMMQKASNAKIVAISAHISVIFSLVGFLGGSGMGIVGFLKENKPSTTVADCLIMAALTLVHVVASVQHFIKIAGLKRKAKAQKMN